MNYDSLLSKGESESSFDVPLAKNHLFARLDEMKKAIDGYK